MIEATALIAKYRNKIQDDLLCAIVDLAARGDNLRLITDESDQARLLIDCMVGNAPEQDTVCVYGRSLKKGGLDGILASIQGNARILVNDLSEAEAIRAELPPAQQAKIEIRGTCEKVLIPYYTVGDRAYHFAFNPTHPLAVANFNEPNAVLRLTTRFDKMWEEAGSRQPGALV
jgi:hypothetical protein